MPGESIWTTAMLAGLSAIQTDAQGCIPLNAAKAIEMYLGYVNYYRDDVFTPVEAEAERSLKVSNGYTITGKLDTLVKNKDDDLIQLEHKTGTRDANSDSVYPFKTKNVNEQITLYAWLMSENEQPIHHTLIDYIKVPTIKPKAIPAGKTSSSQGSLQEIRTKGTYYGTPLTNETLAEFGKLKKVKENIECYRYRVRDQIKTNPEKFFARSAPIYRGNMDMLDQMIELMYLISDIEDSRTELARIKANVDSERADMYYRNTSQCFAYNTECEYMRLCDGTSTTDNGDWEPRTGGSKTGSKSLSFSKGTCFKSCRRKFYYRYVKGIQRTGRDTASLRIGSLFHIGLEYYFKDLISQRKG